MTLKNEFVGNDKLKYIITSYHVIFPILVSFHAMARIQDNVGPIVWIGNIPTERPASRPNIFMPSQSEVLFPILIRSLSTVFELDYLVPLLAVTIHTQFWGS